MGAKKPKGGLFDAVMAVQPKSGINLLSKEQMAEVDRCLDAMHSGESPCSQRQLLELIRDQWGIKLGRYALQTYAVTRRESHGKA